MDKTYYKNRRENRINGHKNCKIGIPLGIQDKNNIELYSGDKILWKNNKCIILWNTSCNQYYAMIMQSQWYGDNIYSDKSYGKGFPIPMDNGSKMLIEKII